MKHEPEESMTAELLDRMVLLVCVVGGLLALALPW
jgi:hypothetical protein